MKKFWLVTVATGIICLLAGLLISAVLTFGFSEELVEHADEFSIRITDDDIYDFFEIDEYVSNARRGNHYRVSDTKESYYFEVPAEETITGIDFETKTVASSDGDTYKAEKIITTIPWTCFTHTEYITAELKEDIKKLKSSAIETRYVPQNLDTQAQWIYYPEEKLPYHRILVRHNFCEGSKGYWTETRQERVELFDKGDESYRYMNEYAYPLNTIEKPDIMDRLLAFAQKNEVYGLGRWGEHNHYNSDVTVERAMELFERLFQEN